MKGPELNRIHQPVPVPISTARYWKVHTSKLLTFTALILSNRLQYNVSQSVLNAWTIVVKETKRKGFTGNQNGFMLCAFRFTDLCFTSPCVLTEVNWRSLLLLISKRYILWTQFKFPWWAFNILVSSVNILRKERRIVPSWHGLTLISRLGKWSSTWSEKMDLLRETKIHVEPLVLPKCYNQSERERNHSNNSSDLYLIIIDKPRCEL